jgi:hypothetical protein
LLTAATVLNSVAHRYIRRKEWERKLGCGHFFWGIGQSLGEKARVVTPDKTSMQVIFSPMLSKPKSLDIAPDEVVLWNAWVDANGQTRQLPAHSFITSRAHLPSGRKKEAHYALVCFSNQKLNSQSNNMCIVPKQLRNVITNKPLGGSQVTAVVQSVSAKEEILSNTKSYSVSFTAELQAPYCIQLAQPMLLEENELFEIREITSLGDIESWNTFVGHIRSRMARRIDWVQGTLTLDCISR